MNTSGSTKLLTVMVPVYPTAGASGSYRRLTDLRTFAAARTPDKVCYWPKADVAVPLEIWNSVVEKEFTVTSAPNEFSRPPPRSWVTMLTRVGATLLRLSLAWWLAIFWFAWPEMSGFDHVRSNPNLIWQTALAVLFGWSAARPKQIQNEPQSAAQTRDRIFLVVVFAMGAGIVVAVLGNMF